MEIKDVENIKDELQELYQMGIDQISDYRKTYQQSVSHNAQYMEIDGMRVTRAEGMARILTDPQLFLYNAISAYWTLYEAALNILEQPAIRFMMRSLMEMCYLKVIYFESLSDEEKRQKALMFWICTDGLIIDTDSAKDPTQLLHADRYSAAIELLNSQEEKERFKALAQQGYPKIAFHKLLHSLLPSISDPVVGKKVESVLAKIWNGKSYSAQDLDIQFRSTSMMLHAHPISVTILNNDKTTIGHVLHSAKPMHFTGVTIIRFCEDVLKWSVAKPEALERIQNEFKDYLYGLWQRKIPCPSKYG